MRGLTRRTTEWFSSCGNLGSTQRRVLRTAFSFEIRYTGDIKIPVDRGSDLASYQESVWAILPDTVSLEFGFAHGREFVVD